MAIFYTRVGVSLGGLAATYIGYKNPNIFGNVLS